MKTAILAVASLSGISTLSAQSARKIPDPTRIAVGVHSGEQVGSLSVEATNTGWVAFGPRTTFRPDAGEGLPSSRMMAEARDVHRFAEGVRALLSKIRDTALFNDRETVRLGNGRYNLRVSRWPPTGWRGSEPPVMLVMQACEPGTSIMGPRISEMQDIVNLLDSAAMMVGGGEGNPPTLSRPYYASEVSCPVIPNASNGVPSSSVTKGARDVGAQFVVDTAGRVEPGSIGILPGTARPLAHAVRSAISEWRFTPAEIDGTPVRQVVQMVVSFAPKPPSTFGRLRVDATNDGWVHVVHRHGSTDLIVQDWFRPDSIEAWVARVRALNREAAQFPDDFAIVRKNATIGSERGIRITSRFYNYPSGLAQATTIASCAAAFNDGDASIENGEFLLDAAREARRNRTSPRSANATIRSAADVACSAWLPWTRSTQRGIEGLWQYPVGPYPASMRATNARADVLASFVVDTSGAPILSTVSVMRESDPRAAAALRGALRTMRFRPATRGGQSVRQRVIQSIRFEPPPVCATLSSGPACPRRYSDR